MKKLLVIVPDCISGLVAKGEFPPRYYNPGELFDEVHILMTNHDKVDPAHVQHTVGRARVFLHNLPEDRYHFVQRRIYCRPWLLKSWACHFLAIVHRRQIRLINQWAQAGVILAKQIKPNLIRSYGHQINSYVAGRIKKALGIPYVVSLHGNPDVDYLRGRLGNTPQLKLLGELSRPLELEGIRGADHVIAVYSPIVEYLHRNGIESYSVIHNVVGIGCEVKKNYEIDPNKVQLVCVGRQKSMEKDPSPIIEALADLPETYLTLVGDGDLHSSLREKVRRLGLANRVQFIKKMPNSKVLKLLSQSDIFVYSSINYEISKTTIEAALTGLPVVINDRNGQPAKELLGSHFMLVDGTPESYMHALKSVIMNKKLRERLGRLAYQHASENWSPKNTEARYVEIYRRFLPKEVQ